MSLRTNVAALGLSAVALVGILVHEGYNDNAYIPVAGDVPTIGFGTTGGVALGDKTTPTKALVRAMQDVQAFEGALKNCVKVDLHHYEYDAYISLSYNIGSKAFCSSTLVKMLNTRDYEGACKQILRWDRFQGRPLKGLTVRRQAEYKKCIGQ